MPLSDVMTGDDTFDWTALEALLDASAGRLKHSVLRFFVDHPNDPTVNTLDNPETSRGAPRFFNPALAFNSYAEHGGGHSPDCQPPLPGLHPSPPNRLRPPTRPRLRSDPTGKVLSPLLCRFQIVFHTLGLS